MLDQLHPQLDHQRFLLHTVFEKGVLIFMQLITFYYIVGFLYFAIKIIVAINSDLSMIQHSIVFGIVSFLQF